MRYLIACFILLASNAFAAPPFQPASGGLFTVESTSPLSDLVSSMVDGEWKLIPGSDFNDIRTTEAERDAINSAALIAHPELTLTNVNFWGIGSKQVMEAWNSAAFDSEGNRWFFMGGGHNDYGGNEVYEYDFDTLAWTRLNMPEPLTVLQTVFNPGYYAPAIGPVSPHTYDGLLWNPTTQTLWMLGNGLGFKYTGPPLNPDLQAVWEFDPATETWTSHAATETASYPAAVFIPVAEKMFSIGAMGSTSKKGYLYDNDGTETLLNSGANLHAGGAVGNMFRVPDTASPAIAGKIFKSFLEYTAAYQIAEYTLNIPAATATVNIVWGPDDLGFDSRQAGYAFHPIDEVFYVWSGGRPVYTFDPSTYTWATIENLASASAPNIALDGGNRIFDKWIYLESVNVFAGIHDADSGGIWLWKPPTP